jgi:phosphinothricin acetyltransferase
MTVYVDTKNKLKRIGKNLYVTLEVILKKQNIININACITSSNLASIGFHEHMGYKTVGHFTKCGYKFGIWHDMIWMEKMIGQHAKIPNKIIPFTQLDDIENYCQCIGN